MSPQYSAVTRQLSSIPTLSDLYKSSRLQAPPPDASIPPPSLTLNSKISLTQTSITTLEVTCIVNAANTSLLGGGGVDGAIHTAAGPALFAECRALDGCATGSAKLTSAYELPAEYVIHAVGPVYARAKRQHADLPAELLRGCYRTSLELAKEKEGSIAFSCVSTGVYGYPSKEAAAVAAGEVRRFLEEEDKEGRLERVIFCCFEDKDVRAYEQWLPKIFPPSPSDLPTDTDSKLSPPATTNAPPEPTTASSAEPSSSLALDPISAPVEEWETIEKPSTTISLAQSTESLRDDEGEKIEAIDAKEEEEEEEEEGVKVEAIESNVVGAEFVGSKGQGQGCEGDGNEGNGTSEGKKVKGVGSGGVHGLLKDW